MDRAGPPGPDLPAGMRLVLDPDVRRIDGDAVLVGGAPLRVLRLTRSGKEVVDRLVAGEPVPTTPAGQLLARRLLDAGMAHPRPDRARAPLGPEDVTVVVPVRDRVDGLVATLGALGAIGPLVVVDDGSLDAPAVRAAVRGTSAELVRHDVALGPGAARNTGWRRATSEVVAFVDVDCEPAPGWLPVLLAHLADPCVVAVAPRIQSRDAAGVPAWLVAYEATRSPLDLGPREAPVRPRGRVPYVPTAALVVRRAALDAAGGFDEEMRFGEDVDLVWRLVESGWTVRYEPSVQVSHPPRVSLRSWLRQRYDYGTSAAPLAARHGAAVTPLAVSGWSAAVWGLVGGGFAGAGAVLAGATTGLLEPRLRGLDHPWQEAARLAGRGHLGAGRLVADAVRRAWWPVALPAALASRRARRAVLLAATVPLALEWREQRPALDPLRWSLLRLTDDVAYGAGVWAGCVRLRSAKALAPDLSSWPGRRRSAVER